MANKINLTFLGTASAVPTYTRNHMSMLLDYKDEHILIDCGEGTQRQFRLSKLNPCSITKILITHFHGDHVFGIPGLLHTLALNNYSKTLYIYGPKGTKEFMKNIFNTFIHNEKIKFEVHEVTGKFFVNKDFELHAYSLDHDAPTNGYIFQEKNKRRINKDKLKKLSLPNTPELAKLLNGKDLTINNKKIKAKDLTFLEKGKKISFIFDTRLCENAKKLAKDSDLAVIEATFLETSEKGKELAKEYKHMTAKQAAELAKKQKVKELVLTHLSQRYENKENLILDEAKKIFKNTKIAHDFMNLKI